MRKKIVLLTLVPVFLLSAMVVTSSAQERIAGVNLDDWFRYGDIIVNWSSDDPNATFPPSGNEWLEEMNETEWMLMSVQNVSHTTISLQTVKHFKDGTEKTENGSLNIDTGIGNMPAPWIHLSAVISANLSVNDSIYTSYPFSTWKINETVVRTYPDGARETNHLNMTWEHSWIVNETIYNFINYYWDRSTGILVVHSFEEIDQVGEYLTTWSMSYRITESNVWTVPEFPTWTSMLLILIILTVAVAIYKRTHAVSQKYPVERERTIAKTIKEACELVKTGFEHINREYHDGEKI